MPTHSSESLILRTYPLKDSDLIVSFFTRDLGKLRGVARHARRPKSKFGAGLERLSHSQVFFFQRENRELLTLTGCDLLHSQFALASNYDAGIALDYVAELADLLLPPNDLNERFFRLLLAVLDFLRSGGSIWCGTTYFALWAVRLSGLLGEPLISEESRAIGQEMLTTPIAKLAPREWQRQTARDLRRWLLRDIEGHVERRVQTAAMLENLG
jgi:DNA repair protein RecO (recombination protein O)